MKLFKMGIISSLVLAASALVAPAHATTWPANYSDWSECSNSVTHFCVVEFKTDTDGNSTNDWVNPPSSIHLHAYFYNLGWDNGTVTTTLPNFQFNISNDTTQSQDLAPDLPVGTKFRTVVNLGNWDPRADFSNAVARISTWNAEKVNGNWILTVEGEPLPWTVADHCVPWDEPWTEGNQSGNFCNNPQNIHEYASNVLVALGSDPTDPNYPQTSQSAGLWVANNATGGQNPTLDVENHTFEMLYAGPPTKTDGSPNAISAQAFIPDHTLQDLYGVVPSSVLASGAFSVTRSDGSTTSTVNATITHTDGSIPGIRITIPEIVTYVIAPFRLHSGKALSPAYVADRNNQAKTHPKIKIKMKKFALARPGAIKISSKTVDGKFVRLGISGGNFADDLDAQCTKGSKTRKGFGFLAYSSASVKLTKGTWTCKVRATRKSGKKTLYGAWSKTVQVKIK